MTAILELRNIHKSFEVGTVNENHVLKGIDLTIEKEEFVTIIGGNGAGKSTLLNSVAGTYVVDEGAVLLNGKDATNKKNQWKSKKYWASFSRHKDGNSNTTHD